MNATGVRISQIPFESLASELETRKTQTTNALDTRLHELKSHMDAEYEKLATKHGISSLSPKPPVAVSSLYFVFRSRDHLKRKWDGLESVLTSIAKEDETTGCGVRCRGYGPRLPLTTTCS